MLELAEDDARVVLLARAFEEADREYVLLSRSERRQLTRDARVDEGDEPQQPGSLLVRRARLLCARLEEQLGHELHTLRWARAAPPAWPVLTLAFVLGAAGNLLGTERHINVLAAPLLLVLAWNLLVYLVLVAARVRGMRSPSSDPGPAPGPGAWSTRLSDLASAPLLRRVRRGARAQDLVAATAAASYLARWRTAASRKLDSSLRAILHSAAAVWAVGAILSMYQRGLVARYEATWESTFLDREAASRVIEVLLAPARWLSEPLPALGAQGEPMAGGAAPWIHAWTITALVLVVARRLCLAWVERRRAAAAARRIGVPITDRYFRALLSPARGGHTRVLVHPYSYTLHATRADQLKAMLHDVVGARADVSVRRMLTYGAELEELALDAADDPGAGQEGLSRLAEQHTLHVLLFTLGQTPELEVHAHFVRELVAALEDRAATLLVLIDAAPYRDRLEPTQAGEARLEERRRAWERVVRESQQEVTIVDLDQAPEEALLETLVLRFAALDASKEHTA